MLNALKNCFLNVFKFIFTKMRFKSKKETIGSKISVHQEASLGFLLNMYNNINLYNINFNNKDKKNKLDEIEEIKKQLENYLICGGIDEIQDIKTL